MEISPILPPQSAQMGSKMEVLEGKNVFFETGAQESQAKKVPLVNAPQHFVPKNKPTWLQHGTNLASKNDPKSIKNRCKELSKD